MSEETRPHTEIILDHIREHGRISMLKAQGVYRIHNLKGRIADLRAKGYPIVTTMRKDDSGKTYAEYSLPEEVTEAV